MGCTDFASLGSGGDYHGNMSRDWESLVGRSEFGKFIEPYFVPCSMKNVDGMPTLVDVPILLPHDVAHAFWGRNPGDFRNRFVGDQDGTKLVEFWTNLSENSDWFNSWK